jgi:hypothetical protein
MDTMRTRTALILLSIGLTCLAGCTTTNANTDGSGPEPPEAPGWASAPPEGTDASYFVGRTNRAPSKRQALEGAKQRALARVAEEFAVRVQGGVEVTESTGGDDGYTYRIQRSAETKTIPISVESFEVTRREARSSGGEYWGWSLVKVPHTELARIEREFRGQTALYVGCEPAKLCPTDLRSRIETVASEQGLELVPEPVESAPSRDSLGDIAVEYGAAELLDVRFEVTKTTDIEGEYFARVRLDWKRYGTDDREMIDSRTIGPVKGGHFSTDKAVADAIEAIIQKL